jgi:hypothetical protein
MPKPRITKASPTWNATPHTLSEGARGAMLRALGLDKEPDGESGAFWWDAEMWLGGYAPGVLNVNQAPIPSQYVSEFTALGDKALHLTNDLSNLNGYFEDELERKKFDSAALKLSLATFYAVASEIAAAHRGKLKRGARGDRVLYHTIQTLRAFFHNNYRGSNTPRLTRGAFNTLSERERHEEAFVRAALLDARIIPKNSGSLRRYLRDPRCALPHERAQTVERIAGKVLRKRKGQNRAP